MKDKMTVLNIIGCILKKPDLLLEDDYNLEVNDFPERFHKIVFASINNLVLSGIKKLTSIDIDNFLSQYDKQYKIFSDNDGIDFLEESKKLANVKNFPFYYNKLKKISLLSTMEDEGFDISEIYDEDEVDISLREQMQADFDRMTIDDILNAYEVKFIKLKESYSSSSEIVNIQAGEGMTELKEEYKKVPEMGMPGGSALYNTIARGLRLKKFYLRSSPSGIGKSVSNTTRIPTPNGWKTVGDIKAGDYLFDRLGNPTKVLQTHPQTEKKEIYEVHFADGRMLEVCSEHLWEIYYGRASRSKQKIMTTQEIVDQATANGGFTSCEKNFSVRLNKPVQYEEKEFKLHPYSLGALLGDGSFRYKNNNKLLSMSSNDEFIVNKIASLQNWQYDESSSERNYHWYFKHVDKVYCNNTKMNHIRVWVEEALSEYPKLWNTLSHNKYIPEEYLLGSIDQRYALLQGLMDTDGSIDEKGRVSFYTVSEKLRDGVVELARSLGMITTIKIDKRQYRYSDCGYVVSIQASDQEKMKVFSLPRHLRKVESYVNNGKRKESRDFNKIVDIISTGKYVDMTCFTVDNEEHLFQVGDYIVTHNTRLAVGDICPLAVGKYYDWNVKKWVDTGISEPCLFITTELEKDEIQTIMIANISGVNEEKILDAKYTPEEEKIVDEAIEIIKNSPLWIEEQPTFSITDIENCIKRNKLENGIGYVFFDYIFMSVKMLVEVSQKARGTKLREDNVLYMFADKMKEICNKLNVHVSSSSQLNGEWENVRDANQNVLRGAKSLADKLDVGSVVLSPTEADLEAIQPIIENQGGFKPVPNMVYHIYKVRRGRLNKIKLWVYFDYGTVRTTDLFVTTNDYRLIDVEATTVEKILEMTLDNDSEDEVATDQDVFKF